MLYLSVPAAIAAARYGEWLLEQPRSSVLTLTFKQSASLDNKVATSEFSGSFVIKGISQGLSAQCLYLLMERSHWFVERTIFAEIENRMTMS